MKARLANIVAASLGLLLAGAVVVLLPVLLLFIFLQKYFVRGIAVTGLK